MSEVAMLEMNAPLLHIWLSYWSSEKCRDVIQASPRGSSEKELTFAMSAVTHANDCIRHPLINIKHKLVIAPFRLESDWSSIFELFNHLEPRQPLTNYKQRL